MTKRHSTIETDAVGTLASAVDAARSHEPALSDIALARVGHRLFPKKSARPQRRSLFGLRFATLAAMLVLGSAVGAAATVITLRVVAPQLGSLQRATQVEALPGELRQLRAIRTTPAQTPTEPEPAVAPVVEPVQAPVEEKTPTAPVTSPAATIARPARAWVPAASPSLPEETAVTREARQLASALDRLRKNHKPQEALAALDAYLREHPGGTFVDEAHMARAEALAATGDRARAIAELKALATRKPAMREKLNKLIDAL